MNCRSARLASCVAEARLTSLIVVFSSREDRLGKLLPGGRRLARRGCVVTVSHHLLIIQRNLLWHSYGTPHRKVSNVDVNFSLKLVPGPITLMTSLPGGRTINLSHIPTPSAYFRPHTCRGSKRDLVALAAARTETAQTQIPPFHLAFPVRDIEECRCCTCLSRCRCVILTALTHS